MGLGFGVEGFLFFNGSMVIWWGEGVSRVSGKENGKNLHVGFGIQV